MRAILRHIYALHVSLAYISMLTGFGMILFTVGFFFLLFNPSDLPIVLHGLLTYLLFVIGPGAIALAVSFYRKSHQHSS